MRVTVVNDVTRANGITHAGSFHADEVLTTVILALINDGDFSVYRAKELPSIVNHGVIVYDIGEGRFDHHQKEKEFRENGIQYAAAGKIWKEFGHILTDKSCNSTWVHEYIDSAIIQGVDAIDNGQTFKETATKELGFSKVIESFNPFWDSDEDINEAFLNAVNYAHIIFKRLLDETFSKAKAIKLVEEAIESSANHLMILHIKSIPWDELIFESKNPKSDDVWYVIYPSNRGEWCFRAVPCALKSFNQRKPLPKKWWGLRGEEFQNVTRVNTAIFCHKNGFMGSAKDFDDALKLANMAKNEIN